MLNADRTTAAPQPHLGCSQAHTQTIDTVELRPTQRHEPHMHSPTDWNANLACTPGTPISPTPHNKSDQNRIAGPDVCSVNDFCSGTINRDTSAATCSPSRKKSRPILGLSWRVRAILNGLSRECEPPCFVGTRLVRARFATSHSFGNVGAIRISLDPILPFDRRAAGWRRRTRDPLAGMNANAISSAFLER